MHEANVAAWTKAADFASNSVEGVYNLSSKNLSAWSAWAEG